MSRPKSQTPRWLLPAQVAWVIVVTAVLLMYIAGLVLQYSRLQQVCTAAAVQCGEYDYATPTGVAQLAARGVSLDNYALLLVTFLVVTSLIPIVFGVLIFYRRRSEPFALLVSFFLVIDATTTGPLSVLVATYPLFGIPAQLILLMSAVLLALFLGLFPNGRMVPRIYWAVVVYFSLGYFLQDTLGLVDINSPMSMLLSWTGWLSVLFGGVAAQIYRYFRVSTPIERQKTRWVLFGMGAMIVVVVSLLVYTAITGNAPDGKSADLDLPRRIVFLVIENLAFLLVFLSIGMAILRTQLFDIDVIIRKSLQYGVLSALLALIFFGSVVLLQGVFGASIGESPPLIVFSTLLMAALFNLLRRRVQDFLDRRFFRKKYEAQKVLAAFAQTARDEVKLEKLTAELVQVVEETMQPQQVLLWLKPMEKKNPASMAPHRSTDGHLLP